MGLIYLSIPKLQWCKRWSLGMDEQFHSTLYWACDYLSISYFRIPGHFLGLLNFKYMRHIPGMWLSEAILQCTQHSFKFHIHSVIWILRTLAIQEISNEPKSTVTFWPSSNDFLQNSVNWSIACWLLYPFLYADEYALNRLSKYDINWSAMIHSKILEVIVSIFTGL